MATESDNTRGSTKPRMRASKDWRCSSRGFPSVFHFLPNLPVQGFCHVASVFDETTVYIKCTDEGAEPCNVFGELCVGNCRIGILLSRDPTWKHNVGELVQALVE